MVREVQVSLVSNRERLRYGFGAVCIGIAALLFLLSFHGGTAQGLAAPMAPNAITIDKSNVTSIVEPNNGINEAVAGELVTVTVVYTISDETIYDASPCVVLMDGLYPIGSSPAWSEMYTGTTTQLRALEGSGNVVGFGGALIVFPEQETITGTDAITMVVHAVRTQYQYVGSTELSTTNLRVQGIIRYCADAPGCATKDVEYTGAYDTAGQVRAILPDISMAATPVYLDADGVGAGGEQVRLTFNAANGIGRPTAHDIVFTATLGSGLTYDASHGGDGAGAGTVSMAGGITYVAWDVPVSLEGGASWQAVITATLPSTFTIGTEFAHGAQVVYETFAGDVPNEGVYTDEETMTPLLPGITHSKHSNLPTGTDIRIGEMLTYTVVFTQGTGTSLLSPYYMDDLPLGFHYISGTLAVQGGAVVTDVTVTAGAEASGLTKERLSWFMESMPVSESARYITAIYEAHNTGLDYNGDLVLTSSTDFASWRASPNSAVLNWRPPTGITVSSLAAVAASVDVYQPYLGNLNYFKTSRTDGDSYNREVGQFVRFKSEFRNTGRAPAYEVELCDQLPTGLVLNTSIEIAYSSGFPNRLVEPEAGDNLLCWELDVVFPGTTYSAEYYVEILETAIPGAPLANNFYAVDYTSMPGDVPGERHYNLIPMAIPSTACSADPEVGCLSVLGLAVDKTPWQTNVGPGSLVTYTLSYEDTSIQFNYQDVVLTDTFDTDLSSFVAAVPAPAQQSAGQLVWNVGDLSDSGGTIDLTMEVVDLIPDGVYELPNNLSWSSTEIPLHTITRTVALQAANLNLALYGPEHVHADEDIVYTVVYSNTGSAVTSTVALTLDYGPYVEFVSSTPLTPCSGTDNVFDDVVPNTGVNHTLTVNLRVKAPLPYDLFGPLTASALLESPGAEAKQADISMVLDRPVLVLEKTGPQVAPGVGQVLPYEIRVHNQGTYTATGSVITDTWGPYLEYRTQENESFGWILSGDGTYATQSLGELGVGEIVTLLLQMTVAENSISYMNTVNLTSDQTTEQEEVEYTWQSSIATTKSATPITAFPGRTLTYTIYYTNTSPSPMLNALITDTLPIDFVYEGYSALQGGCQSAWVFTPPSGGGGGDAVWSCDALIANGSGHFLIWGSVNASAEGENLENSTVTSADDIPVRPIQEPLVTRVARPWLHVDKVAVPSHPVAPGDLITYTLTYENDGTDSAYNVIIKDQLPAQLTFAGCDPACTHDAGLVSWTIGEVPVDTTGDVFIYATVNAGTGGQTAVNSDYTIENTTAWQKLLPSETDQGAPVNTTILNPQLTLTKVAVPEVVQAVNDTVAYTITYANTGGGLLHNVAITDVLDTYTSFDSASAGCVHTGEVAGGTVTCQLGDLANGESRQIVINVSVLTGLSAGDSILNQAQGRTDEAPLTSSNTTTVWYQIAYYPELVLAPTSFAKSASEGSTTVIEDTLTVSNEGDANLFWNAEVMTPTEATWLRIAVGSDDPDPDTVIWPQVTAPGASTDVNVYFDPTGLAEGVYTAWLRVLSNDADEGDVLVEVTFTIRAPDEDHYIYLPLVLRNHQ
ncbi:MAG: DUF7507 domain-containing protein [Anaerolineae bacterium]